MPFSAQAVSWGCHFCLFWFFIDEWDPDPTAGSPPVFFPDGRKNFQPAVTPRGTNQPAKISNGSGLRLPDLPEKISNGSGHQLLDLPEKISNVTGHQLTDLQEEISAVSGYQATYSSEYLDECFKGQAK